MHTVSYPECTGNAKSSAGRQGEKCNRNDKKRRFFWNNLFFGLNLQNTGYSIVNQ